METTDLETPFSLAKKRNKIYAMSETRNPETRQSEPDENINIIPEIFYGYFNF